MGPPPAQSFGATRASGPPLVAPDLSRQPFRLSPSRLAARRANVRVGKASEAPERAWASYAREAGVPSGWSLGRNLRSKTRWFAGFCNSHHVSHFATFFIDARAEISVAGSHLVLFRPRRTTRRKRASSSASAICIPWRHSAPYSDTTTNVPSKVQKDGAGKAEEKASPRQFMLYACAGRVLRKATTMILPQVHLRKPCYDFSFL